MNINPLDFAIQRALSAGAERDTVDYIRVSSLYDCARQQGYRSQDYPEGLVDPNSAYQMLQGHWHEAGVAQLLEDTDFPVEHSQLELDYRVGDTLVMRGHIDGMMRISPGSWALWECKAMSAYRVRMWLSAPEGRRTQIEEPGYYMQVQTYMHLLRLMGYDVRFCYFTIVVKDLSAARMLDRQNDYDAVFVERIEYDEAFAEQCIARAESLYQALFVDKVLPRRERTPQMTEYYYFEGKKKQRKTGDWDCTERFCPFFATCDPVGAQ